MRRQLGLFILILFFCALALGADKNQEAAQILGQAQQQMQNNAAMTMSAAASSGDKQTKLLLMMMAMQQQMQANAYKSSKDKAEGKDKDKDKKSEDDKKGSQIAMPSPQPENPIKPTQPEENLVFVDKVKEIQKTIESSSSEPASLNRPIAGIAEVNAPALPEVRPIVGASKAPAESPAPAKDLGPTTALTAIAPGEGKAKEKEVTLSSVGGLFSGNEFSSLMGGSSSKPMNLGDLNKLSTQIEQTVHPESRKPRVLPPEVGESSDGSSSESRSSGIDAFFESLNAQMEGPSEENYEDQMGVEYGDWKTGKKRVANIFQVAQFLYQVAAEGKRLNKKVPTRRLAQTP